MRFNTNDLESLAKKGSASAKNLLNQIHHKAGSSNRTNTGKGGAPLCNHLAAQLTSIGAPEFRWADHPKGEYQFYDGRRWRFDFFFPEYGVAIEVEGGVGTHRRGRAVSKEGKEYLLQSRHLTPAGFEEDAIKYFAASTLGYSVIRASSKMVSDDRAVGMAILLLESKGWEPPAKGRSLRNGYKSVINSHLGKSHVG